MGKCFLYKSIWKKYTLKDFCKYIYGAVIFKKNNMRYCMRFVILLSIFFLNACCALSDMNVIFISNILPVAIIGEKYHAEIKTKGLPISIMYVKSEQKINGIKIVPSTNGDVSRWYVDVSGIPTKVGEYTFWVHGSTVGTQCPGIDFKQKFTLSVITPKYNN